MNVIWSIDTYTVLTAIVFCLFFLCFLCLPAWLAGEEKLEADEDSRMSFKIPNMGGQVGRSFDLKKNLVPKVVTQNKRHRQRQAGREGRAG